MAFAVPYIMLAMAAVSAAGAVHAAQAQSDAADYNAQIARQNEAATEAQAQAADQALRRDQQRRMGAAIASFGASGVDLSSGSPADVMGDMVRSATLDRLTQKYNYRLKALGYLDQAGLDSANASNSRTAGYFNAASTLGQGAASAIPQF